MGVATIELIRETSECFLEPGPVLICPDVSLVPAVQWTLAPVKVQQNTRDALHSSSTAIDTTTNDSTHEQSDPSLLAQLKSELPNVLVHLANDTSDAKGYDDDTSTGQGDAHMPSFETDSLERASVIPDLSSNGSPGDDIFNMRVESLSDDVFETESDTNRRLGIYQRALRQCNENNDSSCNLPGQGAVTSNDNTVVQPQNQENGYSDYLTSTDSIDISLSSGSYTTDLECYPPYEGEVERREEFIISEDSDHFQFNFARRCLVESDEKASKDNLVNDCKVDKVENEKSEITCQDGSAQNSSKNTSIASSNDEVTKDDIVPDFCLLSDLNKKSNANDTNAQTSEQLVPNDFGKHLQTQTDLNTRHELDRIQQMTALPSHDAQYTDNIDHLEIVSSAPHNQIIQVKTSAMLSDEYLINENANLSVSFGTSEHDVIPDNNDNNLELVSTNDSEDKVNYGITVDCNNQTHTSNDRKVNGTVALDSILRNHHSIEHKGFCKFNDTNTTSLDDELVVSDESNVEGTLSEIDDFVRDIIDYAVKLLMAETKDKLPSEPYSEHYTFDSFNQSFDDIQTTLGRTKSDELSSNIDTIYIDYSQTEGYDNVTYLGSLATIPEVDSILENYTVYDDPNDASSRDSSSCSSYRDTLPSIPEYDASEGKEETLKTEPNPESNPLDEYIGDDAFFEDASTQDKGEGSEQLVTLIQPSFPDNTHVKQLMPEDKDHPVNDTDFENGTSLGDGTTVSDQHVKHEKLMTITQPYIPECSGPNDETHAAERNTKEELLEGHLGDNVTYEGVGLQDTGEAVLGQNIELMTPMLLSITDKDTCTQVPELNSDDKHFDDHLDYDTVLEENRDTVSDQHMTRIPENEMCEVKEETHETEPKTQDKQFEKRSVDDVEVVDVTSQDESGTIAGKGNGPKACTLCVDPDTNSDQFMSDKPECITDTNACKEFLDESRISEVNSCDVTSNNEFNSIIVNPSDNMQTYNTVSNPEENVATYLIEDAVIQDNELFTNCSSNNDHKDKNTEMIKHMASHQVDVKDEQCVTEAMEEIPLTHSESKGELSHKVCDDALDDATEYPGISQCHDSSLISESTENGVKIKEELNLEENNESLIEIDAKDHNEVNTNKENVVFPDIPLPSNIDTEHLELEKAVTNTIEIEDCDNVMHNVEQPPPINHDQIEENKTIKETSDIQIVNAKQNDKEIVITTSNEVSKAKQLSESVSSINDQNFTIPLCVFQEFSKSDTLLTDKDDERELNKDLTENSSATLVINTDTNLDTTNSPVEEQSRDQESQDNAIIISESDTVVILNVDNTLSCLEEETVPCAIDVSSTKDVTTDLDKQDGLHMEKYIRESSQDTHTDNDDQRCLNSSSVASSFETESRTVHKMMDIKRNTEANDTVLDEKNNKQFQDIASGKTHQAIPSDKHNCAKIGLDTDISDNNSINEAESEANRKARLLGKILKSNLSSDLIRRPEYRHHSRYQSQSINLEEQQRLENDVAKTEKLRVRRAKSFDMEYSHDYPRLYKDLAHRDIFLATPSPKAGLPGRYRSVNRSASFNGEREDRRRQHQRDELLERAMTDEVLYDTYGNCRKDNNIADYKSLRRAYSCKLDKRDSALSPQTITRSGQTHTKQDSDPTKLAYVQYTSKTHPRELSGLKCAADKHESIHNKEDAQRLQDPIRKMDLNSTDGNLTICQKMEAETKGSALDSNKTDIHGSGFIHNKDKINHKQCSAEIHDMHRRGKEMETDTHPMNSNSFNDKQSNISRNMNITAYVEEEIPRSSQPSLKKHGECVEMRRANTLTDSKTGGSMRNKPGDRSMSLDHSIVESRDGLPSIRLPNDYHIGVQKIHVEEHGHSKHSLVNSNHIQNRDEVIRKHNLGETKHQDVIKKRTAFKDGTFKVKRISPEDSVGNEHLPGSRPASQSADPDLKDYINAIHLEDMFYDRSVIPYEEPLRLSPEYEHPSQDNLQNHTNKTEFNCRNNKQKHASFDENAIRRDQLSQKRNDDQNRYTNTNTNKQNETSKVKENNTPKSNHFHSRILKDTQLRRPSGKSNFCENTDLTSNQVSPHQFSKGKASEPPYERSLIDTSTSRSFNQNNGRTRNNVNTRNVDNVDIATNKHRDTNTTTLKQQIQGEQRSRQGIACGYADNIYVSSRKNKGRDRSNGGDMRIQENFEIKQKDGPLSLTDAYGPMETNENHSGHALANSTNHLSESMTSLSNRHAPAVSPSRQSTLSKQHSLQSTHSELNGDHRQDEGIKFERLKNLPEEDLMVKIREIIGHMERLEDYHRGDGMRIQKMLGDMYWDYTHMREMIGDCMADGGYGVVSMTMLKTLNSIGIFKNDDVWFPTYYTYNTMWNFTDASSKLAKALSENDAVRLLTLNCGHKPYINAIHSKNVYYVIKASLSILHNIARNSGMKHLFDENKTSETIMPFLESEDEMLKILATLTIANIVDEEENKTIISESGTIHDIVNWIEKSISLPRRRYKGFTPQELTEGLNKLAVNDSNKMRIVDEGALPLFLQMLQHDDIREQSSAARIVWTLCFDKDVRQKINENAELVAVLQKLTDSTNKSLQTNCSGALWIIKGDNEVAMERRPKTNKTKSHVFLSYAWPDKELVLNIRDKLRAEGYAIWIDIEKMGKATLETMTEAIENSAVVLVCMSEKYKQSPNCRTEAEYTFQLKKDYIPLMMQKKYRPDGWVGTILGAKLYFDFSGKYPFEKSFQGLLKELRGRGKVTPNTTPGENNNDHNTDPTMVHSMSLSSHTSAGTPVHHMPLNSAILNMGQEELIKWLRNTKLTECIPAFMEFDGRLLMQLKVMRTEAPEFFYQCLEKRLNMSLIEILKFTRALEEL